MEILKKIKIIFLVVFLIPLVLANKDCERKVTWGGKQVPEWVAMHAELNKDSSCADCHDDGRTTETKPKTHDIAWGTQHGKLLQSQYGFGRENVCYMCHTPASCSTCHVNEEPKSHNNFFRLRGHGLSAGLSRDTCMTCHNTTFCDRCHTQSTPRTHTAAWGSPSNLHCSGCHAPLSSATTSVSQSCGVCHKSNPSHAVAPAQPSNALHVAGADCRTCHVNLRHQDNGDDCAVCHTQ